MKKSSASPPPSGQSNNKRTATPRSGTPPTPAPLQVEVQDISSSERPLPSSSLPSAHSGCTQTNILPAGELYTLVESMGAELNSAKRQLLHETQLREAVQQLSDYKSDEIERLKSQVESLNRQLDWNNHLTRDRGTEGRDVGLNSRKRRKKANPVRDEMPLWIHFDNHMQDLCTSYLFSTWPDETGMRKRIWDMECSVITQHEIERGQQNQGETLSVPEITEDYGSAIVKTTDGEPAVPKCPMQAAVFGGFHFAPLNQKTLLQLLKLAHRSSEGLKLEYPDSSKCEKIAREVAKKRICFFKERVSSALSSRKRQTVDGFLRDLDYPVINDLSLKSKTYERDLRRTERKLLEAKEKLLRNMHCQIGSTTPQSDWHRVATFRDLVSEGSVLEEPECPEFAASCSADGDVLFRNNAAKRAYITWSNCRMGDSASIMDLARLDAWMFSWFELASERIEKSEPRKTGGMSNKRFNARFNEHLPKATECILQKCRATLNEVSPDELEKPFDAAKRTKALMEGTMQEHLDSLDENEAASESKHLGDIFNRSRRFTKAFLHPVNNYHYIALTPCFFSAHICPWLGDVLNCFVGICEGNEMRYRPLRESEVVTVSSDESEVDNPAL